MYLTLAIDDSAARAETRIDQFLEQYYGVRPDVTRKRHRCFAGPADKAIEWLRGYA